MEKHDKHIKVEDNPKYLFSLTNNLLLGKIVRGEIDAVEIAKRTLAGRGYDQHGRWIGFEEARERFGIPKKE